MRFETPNAVMERVDGSNDLAVWQTELPPGAAGPLHVVDVEQVVVVVQGELLTRVDGREELVGPGGAFVLPAGAERRLLNRGSSTVVTVTASVPGAMAVVGDAAPVPVPWAAA